MSNTEKKIREQVALIEAVSTATGMSLAEIGERLAATPETMRKWSAGYTLMGERTRQLLKTIMDQPMPERREPRQAGGGTLNDKLQFILANGSEQTTALVRGMVELAYKMTVKAKG